MFRKDSFFLAGWIYFLLMFPLSILLPEWVSDENGIIENLQLLWLVAGFYHCYKMQRTPLVIKALPNKLNFLWLSGMIYFFLLFMREISWGRTFFTMPDGSMIQYSQMGLYGKLVHPLVAVLAMIAVIMLYKVKIWKLLAEIKLPTKSFLLFLLFIFFSWLAERRNFVYFHGQNAEELAEFGAYMMMYVLTINLTKKLTAGTANCNRQKSCKEASKCSSLMKSYDYSEAK